MSKHHGRARHRSAQSVRSLFMLTMLVATLVAGAPRTAHAEAINDALQGCGILTFGSDAQGFRTASTRDDRTVYHGPYTAPYTSGSLYFGWEGTGGNPDGNLRADDLDGEWQEVWTPVFVDANFSGVIGQKIQFDYKNDTGYDDYRLYISVVGKNGNQYYFYFNDQLGAVSTWSRVQVPMIASAWHTGFDTYDDPTTVPTSPAPSAADFAAVLGNLDRFAISVEGVSGADTTHFDNFGRACDYGDLPESGTSFVSTGAEAARHNIDDTVFLGTLIDGEPDGQSDTWANGDDLANVDDEDSVAAMPALPITPAAYTITAAVHNSSGRQGTVYGWLDLDGNSRFEPTELITATVPGDGTVNNVELTWNNAGPHTANTFARIRFTTAVLSDNGATPADERAQGLATDGEVEDYLAPVPCTDPLVVRNVADDGYESLRWAVACTTSDLITFDPAIFSAPATVTLQSQINITRTVTISGTGAANVLVSGNDASRVFTVSTAADVTLKGLTVMHGNSGVDEGGAIYNNGHLTLSDMHLADNHTILNPPPYLAQWDSSGSGTGHLSGPLDVAVDSSGNSYVIDFNTHVQKYDQNNAYVTNWTAPDGLNGSIALAVDSSNHLYVADLNDNRVVKFDSSGTYLTDWGGLSGPVGIAVDSSNNVYVAEMTTNRIQKFDSSGVLIATIGAGHFVSIRAIAVDHNDNLYAVDWGGNRVLKYDSSGAFLMQWGGAGSANGLFSGPYGIAVDRNDNLYVTELGNYRIQVFNSNGIYLTKWGSQGSGDGQFTSLRGIEVDALGSAFVADFGGNRIQKFSYPVGFDYGGMGGALYSLGPVTVTDSLLYSNTAGYSGGAIYMDDASGVFPLVIMATTIANNQAGYDGGGVASTGSPISADQLIVQGNNATDYGGGIYAVGPVTLTATTVAGNHSGRKGGGIHSGDDAALLNTTLYANEAITGGAIYNEGGLSVKFSTLSGNRAASGGGIYDDGAEAAVSDSIVANSSGGDLVGGAFDGGTAVVQNVISGTLALGPLHNNGGRTPTMALSSDSPAVDAAACGDLTLDQRGVSRPQGAACDIGAFEAYLTRLSGLAIEPGSLEPAFTATTTSYDAQLPATSVVLTVTPSAGAGVTIWINGVQTPSGSLYPVALTNGQHQTVTVELKDAGNSIVNTYTIFVNRAPRVVNSAWGTVQETPTSFNVLVSASDLDGDVPQLTVVTPTADTHGTVTDSGAGGQVTYTPGTGYFGLAWFEFTAGDGFGAADVGLANVVVNKTHGDGEGAPQVTVVDNSLTVTATFASQGAPVTMVLPPNSYNGTAGLLGPHDVFYIVLTELVTPTANVDTPPNALSFGGTIFTLDAFFNNIKLDNYVFPQPVLFTIGYNEALIGNLNPSTLQLFYWDVDTQQWTNDGLTYVSHDPVARTISYLVSHFTEFAYFGAGSSQRIYLPVVKNAPQVYSSNFTADVTSGWQPAQLTTAPNGQRFLGEFGNQSVQLSLDNLAAHDRASVSFDLYLIRSWDGNQTIVPFDFTPYAALTAANVNAVIGPDQFQVQADGAMLLDTTFTNWVQFVQNYPAKDSRGQAGAVAVNSLGYRFAAQPQDATYHITLDFAHSAATLKLAFQALGLQPLDDESWAIDHVTVTLY